FAGLAQRIQAVHRRARGGGAEPRQLEDHPRAGIQLRDRDVHRRPLRGHLDLGAGPDGGCGQVVLLAVAAEESGRLGGRRTRTPAPPARRTGTRSARTTATGSRTRTRRTRTATTRPGARADRSRAKGRTCATRRSRAGRATRATAGP